MEVILLVESMKQAIVNECLVMNIDQDCIEFGCQHAEFMFDFNKNYTAAITSGVAVAQGIQAIKKSS